MEQHIVVLFVGKDFHTFVDDVFSVLFDQLGSVEKSWVIDVGGWLFAVSQFRCSAEELESVQAILNDLKKRGIDVSLRVAEQQRISWTKKDLRLRVEIIGLEHPNIIKRVTSVLDSHHMKMESLRTRVSKTAFSFEMPILDLTIEARADKDTEVALVRQDLAQLAEEMKLVLLFT
jgi:glycine cleavage system regulatory protein